ncbi:MAG: hypothetical protein JW910_10800 [Anaerolineae bacterium]|nr:hypothetical protein [Anaerolineae bacterium]
MGIRVLWDNDERTIICDEYDPEWTWDDFNAAIMRRRELIACTPHRVDVIIVVPEKHDLPPRAMARFKQAGESMPSNMGLTVIVGGGRLTRFTIGTFSRIYKDLPQVVRTADSIEAARALLAAARQEADAARSA